MKISISKKRKSSIRNNLAREMKIFFHQISRKRVEKKKKIEVIREKETFTLPVAIIYTLCCTIKAAARGDVHVGVCPAVTLACKARKKTKKKKNKKRKKEDGDIRFLIIFIAESRELCFVTDVIFRMIYWAWLWDFVEGQFAIFQKTSLI